MDEDKDEDEDEDDTRRRIVRSALSGIAPLVLAAAVVLIDLAAISRTKTNLHSLIGTTLLCGVSSMAVIETVKRLSAVRAAFQLQLIRAELLGQARKRTAEILGPIDGPVGDFEKRELRQALGSVIDDEVLIPLGLGRIDSAFNLPVEQLMPQLADALALARIGPNPDVRLPAHVNDVLEPIGRRLVDLLFRPLPVWDYDGSGDEDRGERYTTERITSRFLEQLQIRVGNRWRHYVRATAAWVAGALGLAIAVWSPADVLVSKATPIAALAGGGFLAWLARDLTAAVERWRR